MTPIQGGEECLSCGYRIQTITMQEAQSRVFAANRETATLGHETR